MTIRRAQKKDFPRINLLLEQVCLVHHKGRPDLFKYAQKKYTDKELEKILQDSKRPVFVAVDDSVQCSP